MILARYSITLFVGGLLALALAAPAEAKNKKSADGDGPPVPCGPFQKERQVICSFSKTAFSAFRSGSEFTPTNAKGLSSSFFTSDRSCGYMARQGPHQFPQKSSKTTLPR